ncbi:MAG: hypothetical protein M5U12_24615 [Verrucomicrobia bacterium]|nr:hypothetical protein [Verrucomicrobiota bacterium]
MKHALFWALASSSASWRSRSKLVNPLSDIVSGNSNTTAPVSASTNTSARAS